MFNTIIVCMYNSMYNSINNMTNKTLHSMKLNITLQVFILSFCIDKQDKLMKTTLLAMNISSTITHHLLSIKLVTLTLMTR